MDVSAEVRFAKRHPRQTNESGFFYSYDKSAVEPVKNIEYEDVEIQIHDVRPHKNTLSIEQEGFEILHLESKLEYQDFFDEEKVKAIFIEELRPKLLDLLGASGVFFHETLIRARHPDYPAKMPISNLKFEQPISRAHADYTVDQARWIMEQVAGTALPPDIRVRAINVWKPLKGPVQEWPLALCDARTIDSDEDLAKLDTIFPQGFIQGHVAFHSPKHRWSYLSNQKASELWVFNSADTQGYPPVVHCAFETPSGHAHQEARESIEFRVFAIY